MKIQCSFSILSLWLCWLLQSFQICTKSGSLVSMLTSNLELACSETRRSLKQLKRLLPFHSFIYRSVNRWHRAEGRFNSLSFSACYFRTLLSKAVDCMSCLMYSIENLCVFMRSLCLSVQFSLFLVMIAADRGFSCEDLLCSLMQYGIWSVPLKIKRSELDQHQRLIVALDLYLHLPAFLLGDQISESTQNTIDYLSDSCPRSGPSLHNCSDEALLPEEKVHLTSCLQCYHSSFLPGFFLFLVFDLFQIQWCPWWIGKVVAINPWKNNASLRVDVGWRGLSNYNIVAIP